MKRFCTSLFTVSLLTLSISAFGASRPPLTVAIPSLQADGQLHTVNVLFTGADGASLVKQNFRIVLPPGAGIPAVALLKDEAAAAVVLEARDVTVTIAVDGNTIQTASLADIQSTSARVARSEISTLDALTPKHRDRTAMVVIGGNVAAPRQKPVGEKFRSVTANNMPPPPNFVCPNLQPCEDEFNYWYWEARCDQYDPYYNCQAVRERYDACVLGEWCAYFDEETILYEYPIYSVPRPICDIQRTREYLSYTRATHYESGQIRYCPSVGEWFTIVVEERTEVKTCYLQINVGCPPVAPTLIDPSEDCIIP